MVLLADDVVAVVVVLVEKKTLLLPSRLGTVVGTIVLSAKENTGGSIVLDFGWRSYGSVYTNQQRGVLRKYIIK